MLRPNALQRHSPAAPCSCSRGMGAITLPFDWRWAAGLALLALLAYRFARSRPALKRRRLLTDARNRFLRDAATARLSS